MRRAEHSGLRAEWCGRGRVVIENAPGSDRLDRGVSGYDGLQAAPVLRPLLRHVLQQLQRPHLDLVVGGLGGAIHQLAGLEGVGDSRLGLTGRDLLLLDLHQSGDRNRRWGDGDGLLLRASPATARGRRRVGRGHQRPVALDYLPLSDEIVASGLLVGAGCLTGHPSLWS